MGGIFGYVCKSPLDVFVVKERLGKLTYRGYDGAGVAYDEGGEIKVVRVLGNISSANVLEKGEAKSYLALGHTRYASRGWPSINNTHPVVDCNERVFLVMDGIIDDYVNIKEKLIHQGHTFKSTTDAEVLPHLLEGEEDPLKGTLKIISEVKGIYAFAFIVKGKKAIYAASLGQPLTVGAGACALISSDQSAFTGLADRYALIPEGWVAVLSEDKISAFDSMGNPAQLSFSDMKEVVPTSSAGYPHFMLKEIYDVPSAMVSASSSLIDKYLELAGMIVNGAKNVYIIGNGTSLHAGLISSYYFADVGIDTRVISAAEFPYYVLNNVGVGSVMIAISQSGETSDVMRSVRLARQRGTAIVGITNTIGSRLAANSSIYLPLTAGPELAVPATKTFVATLVVLRLLATHSGFQRGTVDRKEVQDIKDSIFMLSKSLSGAMPDLEKEAKEISEKLYGSPGAYITSSGINFPVAMEGALKLKEAALVHAEGIQLGELLHGPVALASKGYPVITIRPSEDEALELYQKIKEAVGFRGGRVIELPSPQGISASRDLSPIVNVIPLQFIAYTLGVKNGVPVDTPPGLAKAMIT